MILKGIWLPIITPFLNGEIDFQSYRNLINHYIPKGISGLIPLGTTGESPTVSEYEFEKLMEVTLEVSNNRLPVYMGLGGNDTMKVLKKLHSIEKYKIDGILSVCPYYNRPSQEGIFRHFLKISEQTNLNMIIYNIPYRTGVNLNNETLLRLAELQNIIGIKDSCGDPKQSLELLSIKPKNFSILTGEDLFFYTSLVHGGDGGILASSHLKTEKFIEVFNLVMKNDHQSALAEWWKLMEFIPSLFKEPNPAPIKYCLSRKKLLQSSETRLPIIEISDKLKEELEKVNLIN